MLSLKCLGVNQMGRKRKIVEIDKKGKKLAGALEDCFFRWKDENGGPDTLCIYSTKEIKKYVNKNYMQIYPNGEEAYIYTCVDGSEKQKELFQLLGMTYSKEKKMKRKTYTKRGDKKGA